MNYLWKALGYKNQEDQAAMFQSPPSSPQRQFEAINEIENGNANATTFGRSPQTNNINRNNSNDDAQRKTLAPPLPRLVFSPAFDPTKPDSAKKLAPDHPPSVLQSHQKHLLGQLASTSLLTTAFGDFTREWTLMFSTNEHGRSFPRFVSAIGKIKGPSLIIIQEEDIDVDEHVRSPPPREESGSETARGLDDGGGGDDNDDRSPPSFEKALEETQRPSFYSLPPPPSLAASIPGNVFGCVTFTPWDTIRTREQNAKAANAAKERSARTGVAIKPGGGSIVAASSSVTSNSGKGGSTAINNNNNSSKNQAPQFFGTSDCFVFKFSPSGTTGNENDDEAFAAEQAKIFHPRPTSSSLSNRNFMYFFDTHPDSNSVGIGIGGTGARSCVGNEAGMAFFVDRSLARGEACPGGCITFQYSEQLSRKEPTFRIKALEVWALAPETIERDYAYLSLSTALSSSNSSSTTGTKNGENGNNVHSDLSSPDWHFSSPALGNKHSTAKAMLELNGGRIWSESSDRSEV